MNEDSLTDYELVQAVEGLTPRDDQEYVEGLLLGICTRIRLRMELPDDEIRPGDVVVHTGQDSDGSRACITDAYLQQGGHWVEIIHGSTRLVQLA